jgi:hypothetical protein
MDCDEKDTTRRTENLLWYTTERHKMTDKELLELAAKAAGVEIIPMQIDNVTKQGDNRFIGFMTKADEWPRGWFDPLTDDGDALRLAVKLGISLSIDLHCVGETQAWEYNGIGDYESAKHKEDPYAATRRAITRAAAEIGKTK